MLAVGDSLIITDQDLNQVLVAPKSGGAPTQRATIDQPDLLCAGPNGAIFTGGANGEVRRVETNGTVTVVASDFITVRGVALDATHSRLFVAEHDDDERDGVEHALHILPID